ncbi:MAG TPA: DUF192 domain-containing protein [bacterium]|nr:DUF192 domain-containing protein [bacterium]HPJ72759.1 DUF192 domain-containing protein [bacterium]HPQ66862.1 DUF192 domain-containing protein [bacterium]
MIRTRMGWAFALLLVPWGCGPRPQPGPSRELTIGARRITVEVADTPARKERGLMYRESLGDDEGMLFPYPETTRRAFWMKNTGVPLSIAFISPYGLIVEIQDMAPDDGAVLHTPAVPYRYALEMNRGWFERNGIGLGAPVGNLP